MPHVDIELEDNKQFISNIPRIQEDYSHGKKNTDNSKQLYGFVYKPRDACDKCKSQDAKNMVELVLQLGHK